MSCVVNHQACIHHDLVCYRSKQTADSSDLEHDTEILKPCNYLALVDCGRGIWFLSTFFIDVEKFTMPILGYQIIISLM